MCGIDLHSGRDTAAHASSCPHNMQNYIKNAATLTNACKGIIIYEGNILEYGIGILLALEPFKNRTKSLNYTIPRK